MTPLALLGRNPLLGRQSAELADTHRLYFVGSHVIVYRTRADATEVIPHKVAVGQGGARPFAGRESIALPCLRNPPRLVTGKAEWLPALTRLPVLQSGIAAWLRPWWSQAARLWLVRCRCLRRARRFLIAFLSGDLLCPFPRRCGMEGGGSGRQQIDPLRRSDRPADSGDLFHALGHALPLAPPLRGQLVGQSKGFVARRCGQRSAG